FQSLDRVLGLRCLAHQRIGILRVLAHDLGKRVELRLLLRRDLQLLFQIGDLAVDIAAARLRRRRAPAAWSGLRQLQHRAAARLYRRSTRAMPPRSTAPPVRAPAAAAR